MTKLSVTAYAKVNLSLFITGQREDGYHLLDMVMQNVSLADRLLFEEADGLILEGDTGGAEGMKNLVMKAAALLKEYTGCEKGCRIIMEKSIPAQAGMGGGSADCAAALVGLNRLWGLNLTNVELLPLAEKLGADVPFFLTGGTARVQGIGEIVKPVEGLPVMDLVVVKPEAGLSTPAVFKAWHEKEEYMRSRIDALVWFMLKGDKGNAASLMHNDLEAPAMALAPEVEAAMKAQEQAGALRAMMTGSGTAVIGWYGDTFEAAKAAAQLKEAGWQAWQVRSVPHAMEIEEINE